MYPNLNAEMSRYRITRAELADATGVTQKTLANKLTGKSDWTLKELLAVQNLFPAAAGLTIEYLFATSDPKGAMQPS